MARVIEKYSFGVGDRFAHQAEAQLAAFVEAAKLGIEIVPVWNKSHREHTTIGSEPESVRVAADAAVKPSSENVSLVVVPRDDRPVTTASDPRFIAAMILGSSA